MCFEGRGSLRVRAAILSTQETLRIVRKLWDSWNGDELVLDQAAGVFAREGAGAFADDGAHFTIRGRFGLPPSPPRVASWRDLPSKTRAIAKIRRA